MHASLGSDLAPCACHGRVNFKSQADGELKGECELQFRADSAEAFGQLLRVAAEKTKACGSLELADPSVAKAGSSSSSFSYYYVDDDDDDNDDN